MCVKAGPGAETGNGAQVPKIVDHEHRRQELVEAVWRVIGRVGIDGVTIREIAVESGYSTGRSPTTSGPRTTFSGPPWSAPTTTSSCGWS